MFEVTLAVLAILVVVAMLVACIIKVLVALMGKAGTRPGSTPAVPPKADKPTMAAIPAPGASDVTTIAGHPARHVAAISAAVAAVFDDAAVVVHIEPARGGHGWATEGRAAHHGSHNVGRLHR